MKDDHYTYVELYDPATEEYTEVDLKVEIIWYPYVPATLWQPAEGGDVDDYQVWMKSDAGNWVDPSPAVQMQTDSEPFLDRLRQEFHFEVPTRERERERGE